jgi:RNA recognition motif-containing protein
MKKLYVGNLSFDATEEDLKKLFSSVGVVINAKIVKKEDGKSKGFAFVEMENENSIKQAMSEFNGYDLFGRPIVVNEAIESEKKIPVKVYESSYTGGKKIYIGNLPYILNDADVMKIFNIAGKVKSSKVVMDRSSGKSKGFAFVEMETNDEAKAAVEKLNNFLINGRNIYVTSVRC